MEKRIQFVDYQSGYRIRARRCVTGGGAEALFTGPYIEEIFLEI